MSKKILYITTTSIFPLNSGDRLLTWGILKRMSLNNRVHLLNFKNERIYSNDEMGALNSIFEKVSLYSMSKPSIVKTMLYSFQLLPFMIAKRSDFNNSRLTKMIIKEGSYDVVIWDHLRSTSFFVKNRFCNVLFEHNNEYKIVSNMLSTEENFLKKMALSIQSWFMKNYLKKIHALMDKVLYVSSYDIQNFTNSTKYDCLNRLILDFHHDVFVKSEKIPRTKLLFVGSLDWYPNIKSVFWLIKAIPELQKNNKEFKLDIVGRNPSKALIDAIDMCDGVVLHENVPNVGNFYLNSDIFVAPIFHGAGINIKIFEALSFNIPIVASNFAMRGYDDCKAIKVFDTMDEFVEKILLLSDSDALYEECAESEMHYYNQYQQSAVLEIDKFLII
jgi:polysaccharide biosynthesis protein PslH